MGAIVSMSKGPAELFSVEGKRVAISGGSGVLGRELAFALAVRGARICLIDYKIDRALAFCKEIEQAGGEAIAVSASVTDRAQLEEAYGQAVSSLGGLDVLINGAGGNRKEATTAPDLSFFSLPEEALRWVFDLNLMGTILPSQIFGQAIAEQKAGVILNIASMNAFRPLTKIAAYSAAKAAVMNFTQWLAVHMAMNYAPDIRVNAIAPGFFLTRQNRFLLLQEDGTTPTLRGQQVLGHTPMGRFGAPEDLTGTLLWLLSDASRFVTGVTIPVDGGFNAYSGV